MSNIIWGIGQLVNNPSATLLNNLRKQIFSKESDNVAITCSSETTTRQTLVKQDDKKTVNKDASKNHSIIDASQNLSCSSKLPTELLTKQTQVGTGLKKCHQLSAQCTESLNIHKKVSKATSFPKVCQLDRKIGPSITCLVRDDCTETPKVNVCEKHQRALALLQKWPAIDKIPGVKKESYNKITLLKYKLLEALQYLKLEKIQSIPQYRDSDMEVMKLYKSISVEETTKLSKLNQTLK